MKLRYNYRIYPTKQQQSALAQTFGCARVVWNDALAIVKGLGDGEKWPSNSELQKRVITQAKKTAEREWLGDTSVVPLQQSVRDLGAAFTAFFKSRKGERKGKRLGFPRFKKRSHEQAVRFTQQGFSIANGKVFIAKVGRLKVKWSRPLPSVPSSITVLKNRAGQYHISCVVDVATEPIEPLADAIGIDLGIKTFAVTSAGDYIKAPDYSKLERKIRRFQRRLSRQVKGSNRWHRTRQQIAKLNLKIANIRKDFLHNLSTRVVQENQLTILEDLNVSGMLKNRCLARAIARQGWSMFRSMCAAKAVMYAREFQVISRWEPTSQTCSCCGYRWGKLDLSVRLVKCLGCGTEHDRDGNAAVNIKQVGAGQAHNNKRTVSPCKPPVGAVGVDLSSRLVVEQLTLFAS